MSNAVKYSPDGGEITVAARNAGDGFVRIEIADQGMGISPEDQEKLFTTFYRVDRPETEAIRGTGLGLSIVKSLIERMGGTASVRSEVGGGSTFTLTLPVWTPETADASGPAAERRAA